MAKFYFQNNEGLVCLIIWHKPAYRFWFAHVFCFFCFPICTYIPIYIYVDKGFKGFKL